MPSRNSKEARDKRREKRTQIEKAYKDHVPPQVRHLRQGRWFARVNATPQEVLYTGPVFPCVDCPATFVSSEYLRAHITKKHYPHKVPDGRAS